MTIANEAPRSGARQTVICLHSSGGSGAQWATLAGCLPDGVEVITPDLLGHGARPAWYGAQADIVVADSARIARMVTAAGGDVHLVGHSYGGAVALRVALQRPDVVRSVAVYEPVVLRVLFDADADRPAATEVASVAAEMLRALDAGDAAAAAAAFVDYWSGGRQWASMAPERQASIARRMPGVLAHFIALANDRLQLRDYAALEIPVLYLQGRGTRASARRIASLMTQVLPFLEQRTLDGMGHLGPITHAGPVAQAIASFVGRQMRIRTAPLRTAA